MSCCWFSREHVHTCHLYISTCEHFVDLDISLNAWRIQIWGLIFFLLSLHFQVYVFHIPPCMFIECNNRAFVPIKLYNFQQRISWLSHRWRTQRNAISNVNCRIQWIIESLNASCAPWYSEEHACLSVINISTLFALLHVECWMWEFLLDSLERSALLKYISKTICLLLIGVITIYAIDGKARFSF